ncbi:hypothetical protein EDD86DRAFT_189658 [Gorgonomyces haynaldii]|nr:hypothetical protein EDD86DRAFT_189658 [Gorgonomyces haynaldii]
MSVDVGKTTWKVLPETAGAKITGVHESLMQESEKDVLWYRDNFLGKPHLNYLAPDTTRGPLAVSLIKDQGTYKALVRTNLGCDRLSVPANKVSNSFFRKVFGLPPKTQSVFDAMGYVLPVNQIKACKDQNLPNELLAMEERQVIRSYKFGVIYCAPGQTTEAQALMNSHESSSSEYKEFLKLLGETIQLSGWRGYRAGLDVSGANNTGTQSIYTKWQGYEVMYHIATMLPHRPEDPQQLEKKRHIGNDLVIIIFQQGPDVFDISSIASHQNHMIAVVRPKDGGYSLQFLAKDGVPTFIPDIPVNPVIQSDPVSRDFFLHKLVQGERAIYKAPSFAPKLSRTRSVLLYDIATKFSS